MSTTGNAPEAENDGGLIATVNKLVEWFKNSRLGRSIDRYSIAQGNLLAGGIAYSALFAIAAGLTLAWTIFMAVLGGNEELREMVLGELDQVLPGLLATPGNDGLISPDALILDNIFTLPGGIAAVVLLWTALSVMTALRMSIRAMFGIVAPPENFALSKARDLTGFLALALGVIVAAVLATVASQAASEVLGVFDLDGPVLRWTLRVVGLAAAFAVDWCVYVMLFRFTAGVRAPGRDLMLGAALGAATSGVLRIGGTSLIGAVDDPLLAAGAALVTLLLWVNLAARLALFVSAFTANPPAPERAESAEAVHLYHHPNYITESAPETKLWSHQPLTGTIIPEEPVEEPEPIPEPEPPPERGGLVGAFQRRRVAKAEAKLAQAQLDAVSKRQAYEESSRQAAVRNEARR